MTAAVGVDAAAFVKLGIKNAQFKRGLAESKKDADAAGKGIGKALKGGIAAAAIAITATLTKAFDSAANAEALEARFNTLLGGADKAQARLKELSDFASSTPFQLPGIAEASARLEVLTEGALATGDGLKLVGDVAAGTQQPIEELATWFGRLYDGIQSGRPVGEALARLQELGVITGEARGQIEDLQKVGADSAQVWAVVEGAVGKYNGAMETASKTVKGLVSTLKDKLGAELRELGNTLLPAVKAGLEGLIGLLDEAGNTATLKENAEAFDQFALLRQGRLDAERRKVDALREAELKRFAEIDKANALLVQNIDLAERLAAVAEEQASAEQRLAKAQSEQARLAEAFNASTDIEERVQLIGELEKATKNLLGLEAEVAKAREAETFDLQAELAKVRDEAARARSGVADQLDDVRVSFEETLKAYKVAATDLDRSQLGQELVRLEQERLGLRETINGLRDAELKKIEALQAGTALQVTALESIGASLGGRVGNVLRLQGDPKELEVAKAQLDVLNRLLAKDITVTVDLPTQEVRG